MRRWRPSLAMVLGGGLAGTLALSFAGLVALRYLGPAIGFRNAALGLALFIALATAALGWLLVRLLLRPIRALEQFAAAQEQASAPPPPQNFGTKELHATAQRVIAMASALRDREATVRAYTDHVTHELKTPVSAIRAAVELLQDSPDLLPEDQALVAQIDGARLQIEAQLAALRRAAQARETRYLGDCRLAALLPRLAAQYPGLVLALQGPDLPLPLAPEGMEVVLSQLLRNAAENGARHLWLAVSARPGDLSLTLHDDGPGISPGNADRIFDPFFTTRRSEGGTGMGLAVVRNILQAHRATIELTPGPRGATFTLRFARVVA